MGILTGCTPREEILKRDLNDAIFAADFGSLIAGTADPVYGVAKTFFANTHPASELKKVIGFVFDRLADPKETGAVLSLSTGFGGGKTHTLMALHHLGNHISDLSLGTELLPAAGRPKQVKVVAVDAGKWGSHQAIDHGEAITHSLWGELFYQVGGVAALKAIGNADDPEASPSEGQLEAILPKTPLLILLDEIVIYMAKLSTRGQGNLLGFINSLNSVISRRQQSVLILTAPKGQTAYQQESEELDKVALNAAATRLDEVVNRKVNNYDPIGSESSRVIVRRLLESVDQAAAQKASASYHSLYQRLAMEHPTLISPHAISKEYAEEIVTCYPFHPRLLETAQNKLSALNSFQKSRGVLRLFARILRDVFEAKIDYELITSGDLNWNSQRIQSDLLTRLGRDSLQAAVRADVNDHAGELDGGQPRGIHRRVASAVLYDSLTQNQSSGLDHAEVTLSVLRPDESGEEPSEALERLAGCCWHIYPTSNGRGWQFKSEPNILKQIEERKSQIPAEDAKRRITAEVQGYFGGGTFKLNPWPPSPRRAEEMADLQLVLADDEQLAKRICAHSPDSDENSPMPRSFVNAILAIAPNQQGFRDAIDDTQRLIAAEKIESEHRGAEHALVRKQLEKIMPDLKKKFRIRVIHAFDRVIFAEGKGFTLEESYKVSDDLIMQNRPYGQSNLMRFLEEKKLVYASTDSLDPDRFFRDVFPGTTPIMTNPEIFTAKAVHERILSYRGLRLIRDKGFIRQTIFKSVEAGKILVRLSDGRVYDDQGCVEGEAGFRKRSTGTLTSLDLSDQVQITATNSAVAATWTAIDPDEPAGPVTPRPTARKISSQNWADIVLHAQTRPLLSLKLKSNNTFAAQSLIKVAQPLSANRLSTSVSLSGEIKDGGELRLLIDGVNATHALKPTDLAQKLHTAVKEESVDFEAILNLDFGAGGRSGMATSLQSASENCPPEITPEAEFDKPAEATE